MDIEKTRLLACKSIYWVNMDVNIEETVKTSPTYLDFMGTLPKDNTMPHKMPGRSWESLGADIFSINNMHYLCFVDYLSKFSVVKQVKGSVQMT